MQSPATLRFASGLLKVLIALNLVCLVLFVGVGLGSFVIEEPVIRALAEDGIANSAFQLEGMRLAMLLATAAVAPAHLILTRLLWMVQSVGQGAAFAPINAARLNIIAWALLVTQLLDLGFGWLSYRHDEVMDWSPSVTAWLAVLLLFVLARVFEQGAAMREELDATV